MNPSDFLINLKGKPYLPVAGRIAIIRNEQKPYSIKTTPLQIEMEQGFAVFQAEVWLDGVLLGMGTKQESKRDFPDFVEKAETGAIGRALAIAGFGTIYALQDFDEGERLADAPVTVNRTMPEQKTQQAPPVAPEKELAHQFKAQVARFDPNPSAARLKQVFAIVTQDGERNEKNLRLAIDTLDGCENVDHYETLLRSMGTGDNAPF
jgi:hypothetical protein